MKDRHRKKIAASPETIRISSTVRRWQIDDKKIRASAALILESLGLADCELDLSFIGPRAMRTLNKTWRNKNRSTDVLSFPQMKFAKPVSLKRPSRTSSNKNVKSHAVSAALGDVIISIDDAARNAREDRGPLDRELVFLLVHGVLHLGGHDHEKPSEKKLMFGLQDQLMKKLTARAGQPIWTKCVKRKGSDR
jgi:probable rRNA maturation factor